MTLRSWIRGVALLALTFFTLFCQAGSAADPYEINVIIPLSGSAAFIGKAEAAALGAIETITNNSGGIAGRPIRFAIQDDQSSPQIGVQLLSEVIAKGVPIVLGSTLAATCGAMAPLVKNGPVLYCFSPAMIPAKGSYVFAATPSTDDNTAAAVRFARERGWRRIGIITSTDASGQTGDRALNVILGNRENASIATVAHEHFNLTDISVTAQMAHVKASGAQVLFTWTTGTPFATLLRGAADAGLDIPILASDGNATYVQMKAYAAFLPVELYFSAIPPLANDVFPNGPVKKAVHTFYDAFKSVGIRPDDGDTQAWDAGLIAVNALKKLGLKATAAQIRDYLSSLHGWTGIDGEYDFRANPQRGVGLDSVIIVRWDRAKDTWVGVSKPGGWPL